MFCFPEEAASAFSYDPEWTADGKEKPDLFKKRSGTMVNV